MPVSPYRLTLNVSDSGSWPSARMPQLRSRLVRRGHTSGQCPMIDLPHTHDAQGEGMCRMDLSDDRTLQRRAADYRYGDSCCHARAGRSSRDVGAHVALAFRRCGRAAFVRSLYGRPPVPVRRRMHGRQRTRLSVRHAALLAPRRTGLPCSTQRVERAVRRLTLMARRGRSTGLAR